MDTKLSPKDQELYRAVDEVLHYVWDPIGVSNCPQARDEYFSYLPHIFALLRGGANEEALAAYMEDVTTNRMGLSRNTQHDRETAALLLEWKAEIDAKFA